MKSSLRINRLFFTMPIQGLAVSVQPVFPQGVGFYKFSRNG